MVCSETGDSAPAVPRAHPAPELLGSSFINGLQRNAQFCSHGASRHTAQKAIGRLFYKWSAAKRSILLLHCLARMQRNNCWEVLL
jgi:hypothetical protein